MQSGKYMWKSFNVIFSNRDRIKFINELGKETIDNSDPLLYVNYILKFEWM